MKRFASAVLVAALPLASRFAGAQSVVIEPKTPLMPMPGGSLPRFPIPARPDPFPAQFGRPSNFDVAVPLPFSGAGVLARLKSPTARAGPVAAARRPTAARIETAVAIVRDALELNEEGRITTGRRFETLGRVFDGLERAGAGDQGVPSISFEGAAADIALIRPIFEALYPTMPQDVKNVINQGLVFRLSRDRLASQWADSGVGGWGPEDDPEYRYPDVGLYPGGAIKATFTPFFLTLAQLANRISDPRIRGFVLADIGGILVHEATHVIQYMTKPLHALGGEDLCGEDGACDERKLQDAILKIDYERQAYEKDFAYEKAMGVDKEATKGYLIGHPELLAGLSEKQMEVYIQKSLKKRETAMTPNQDIVYRGAYEPILMAREYGARLPELGRLLDRGGSDREIGRIVESLRKLNAAHQAFLDTFLGYYKMDPAAIYSYTRLIWPKLKSNSEEAERLIKQAESRS